MRNYIRHDFSLPLVTLFLCLGFVSEARSQEPLLEIRLRNGTVIKGHPTIDSNEYQVVIKDAQGNDQKIERPKVSFICFTDCQGASQISTQKDLLVYKDGRRKFDKISGLGKSYFHDGKTVRLTYDYQEVPFDQIRYIKFADHVYYSLQQALRVPRTALHLNIKDAYPTTRHLTPRLGSLINLRELEVSCLEDLVDLPREIGNLRKLEKLVIDNGNGCAMNVALPETIGQLQNLKVLRLYGALDISHPGPNDPPRLKRKSLPRSIVNLQNLEELDLGRNGIGAVPPEVASFAKLKKLSLDYNNLRELPAFIGQLKNLRELSVLANERIKLPASLANLKGLKLAIGNNALTLKDQGNLRRRFPNITFDFENEYDDGRANEEAPKPATKP